MTLLPIFLEGEKCLVTPASKVPLDRIPALKPVAQEMLRVCKVARGVGLAATQVGLSDALIVTLFRGPLVWVNPVLSFNEPSVVITGPEGCLSVPRKVVDVPRHTSVTVTYQDLDGHTHVETVHGPLAVILQHEVDHLNGILITKYEEGNDQVTEQS